MGGSSGYRQSESIICPFTIAHWISQLLHIHPLTLEDILQQDPREKVQDFPNLGYYFISFRTTESQAARERFHREASLLDSSATSQGLDEGFVGETNVYLTIFIDGICCVRPASYHLSR
jgi:magnesium transporter